MTRKYLFIHAGATINRDTRPYFVGVGTSLQANRDFLYLLSYAVTYGCYFELYSEAVRDFFMHLTEAHTSMRPVMLVSAACLARSLRNGTLPNSDGHEIRNAFYLKCNVDAAFYALHRDSSACKSLRNKT